VTEEGSQTVAWDVATDANDAELWDVDNKGVRVFLNLNDRKTNVANLLMTLIIFEPEFTTSVNKPSATRNINFLESYTHFTMPKQNPRDNTVVPEELIHSGDFIGIERLNGLGPTLNFGMGSTIGHTTVALRFDDGLYVCESQTASSYWPVNGIQCTPYATWIALAQNASYNAVWAPLSAEARAAFDEEAAREFFASVEGFDYGFYNFLYGWIDEADGGNYPCLPPDYESNCLQWELLEVVFALIDRVVPSISDQLWNQAWNLRLGTSNLGTAEIYQEAASRGLESSEVPAMVELDTYVYNTTRYGEPAMGPSMVCCVFVCNVWKAAGLFDDIDEEINCAELTDYDDYRLTLLSGESVQLMGDYAVTLNDLGTRDVYEHYAEDCPTLPPDYVQPSDC